VQLIVEHVVTIFGTLVSNLLACLPFQNQSKHDDQAIDAFVSAVLAAHEQVADRRHYFDLDPSLTILERRQHALSWFHHIIQQIAVPASAPEIYLGIAPTAGTIVSAYHGVKTQLMWWNEGFDDLAQVIDAWPAGKPLTLWAKAVKEFDVST
jgi:hypothetical protein